MKTNRELMKQSADLVEKVIQEDLDQKEFDWSHLKQNVRDKLNRFLFNQTKRHPVILPVIMEINQHPKKRTIQRRRMKIQKRPMQSNGLVVVEGRKNNRQTN